MKGAVILAGAIAGAGFFLFAAAKSANAQTVGDCIAPCDICPDACCAGVFCMADTTNSKLTLAIAQGIAVGEGFQGTLPDGSFHSINPASKGTRFNNPGDIMHSKAMVNYPNMQAGWDALYSLIQRIFTGQVASYSFSDTMLEFAATYTADKNPSPELNGWFNAVRSACHKYGFQCESGMTLADFWSQGNGV